MNIIYKQKKYLNKVSPKYHQPYYGALKDLEKQIYLINYKELMISKNQYDINYFFFVSCIKIRKMPNNYQGKKKR